MQYTEDEDEAELLLVEWIQPFTELYIKQFCAPTSLLHIPCDENTHQHSVEQYHIAIKENSNKTHLKHINDF